MKPIPGLEGYFADEAGDIYTSRRSGRSNRTDYPPKKMKTFQNTDRSTHRRVKLLVDGKRKPMWVHRLVLLTFVGEPPSPDCIGLHKNDIAHDNRVENLEWGTHEKNRKDFYNNYNKYKAFYIASQGM